MKKQDEGFTLIELLIVIVILGILATVVVFAVSGIRDRGDAAACNTESRALSTAIEAFYAERGAFPTSNSDVNTDYFRNTGLQYFTLSGGGNAFPTITAATGVTLPTGCVAPTA